MSSSCQLVKRVAKSLYSFTGSANKRSNHLSSSTMVVSVGHTAALSCCGLRSRVAAPETMAGRLAPHQRAVFSAAISAGLKPLSSLWLATHSSPASSFRRVLSRGGLFNLGRTYYGEGGREAASSSPSWGNDGGGRPNGSMTTQVVAYDQYGHGGQPQQELPRPPLIQWEKDLANAVQLIGHVGKDIEIKYLDSGKVVATTSLAVSKGRDKETSWFRLEIWDALAEIAAHHVKKGERIFVTGRIEVKSWVKNDVTYNVATVAVRDICYVEAYSDQSPAYGQSSVAKQEDNVQIGSSNRSQDATTMGSSQRNWSQQQLASQPSQGRPVQRGPSKNNEEEALATEKKWQEYFADPTQWWDNRENKRNPKGPDFKHKSTQEALWINSWNNPPWVEQQLAVLQENQAQHGDSHNRSNDKKLSSFKDSDFLY